LRAQARRARGDRRAAADARRIAALRGYRGLVTALSPVLLSLATYPFVRLDEAKAAARARGIELIDFGMGDPIEPTPQFIQDALAAALPLTEGYPRATGIPELREAIAGWLS